MIDVEIEVIQEDICSMKFADTNSDEKDWLLENQDELNEDNFNSEDEYDLTKGDIIFQMRILHFILFNK